MIGKHCSRCLTLLITTSLGGVAKGADRGCLSCNFCIVHGHIYHMIPVCALRLANLPSNNVDKITHNTTFFFAG